MKYRIVEDLFSEYNHIRYHVQSYSRLFGWYNITGPVGLSEARTILEAKINGGRYKEVK